MKQILKSKGILAFLIFIAIMGIITSNSINNQKNVSGISTNSQIITKK